MSESAFKELEKAVEDFTKIQGQFKRLMKAINGSPRIMSVLAVSNLTLTSADAEHLNQHARLLLQHDKKVRMGKISVHKLVDGKTGPASGAVSIDLAGNVYLDGPTGQGKSCDVEADLQAIAVKICMLVEDVQA